MWIWTGAATSSAARTTTEWWMRLGERKERSVLPSAWFVAVQDGALAFVNSQLRPAVDSRFIRVCPAVTTTTIPHARHPSSTRLADCGGNERRAGHGPSSVLTSHTTGHGRPLRTIVPQTEVERAVASGYAPVNCFGGGRATSRSDPRGQETRQAWRSPRSTPRLRRDDPRP